MPTEISDEEREQILQTIQMFEMITQTQPDDYQSYDVLKEAYLKLGRHEEASHAARKLAEAYLHMGLASSALLECEGILQRDPNDEQTLALLESINEQLKENATERGLPDGGDDQTASLTAHANTRSQGGHPDPEMGWGMDSEFLASHGNDSLARFLIQHELCPQEIAIEVLQETAAKYTAARETGTCGPAFLGELEARHPGSLEELLAKLVELTRFAYIPLEHYEVDRQIVRMLPDELVTARLVVPFDLISRTLMIAVPNPFDGAAKEAAQNALDYNIQWYLAHPDALRHVVKDIYKIA